MNTYQQQNAIILKLKNISIKQALMLLVTITMFSIVLNFVFTKQLMSVQMQSQNTAHAVQDLNQIFTNLLAREMEIYSFFTEAELNNIKHEFNSAEYRKNRDLLEELKGFDKKAETLLKDFDVFQGHLVSLDIEIMDSKRSEVQYFTELEKQKDKTLLRSEKMIELANNISGKYNLLEKRVKRNFLKTLSDREAKTLTAEEDSKIFDQLKGVINGNATTINSLAQEINMNLIKLTSSINTMLTIGNIDLLTSILNNTIVQEFSSINNATKAISNLVANDEAALKDIGGLISEVGVIQNFVITDKNSIVSIKKELLKIGQNLKTNQNDFLNTISSAMSALNEIGAISENLRNNATTETESILQKSKSINAMVILAVFFLLYMSSMMFSQYIKNGIKKIGGLVQLVSAFNLTANVDAKELTENEIGHILKDVKTMITSLSKVISDMIHSAGDLSKLSEALDRNSTTAVEEIKKQKTGTEQIATATNEMSYSSADVMKCSETVNNTIQATAEVVTTARGKVDNTINMVNNLLGKLIKSSATISQVDKQSQDINSVLDVITGITEQTNLLALNAAIEAARAGESGRGFAVVADEVRELAKRSKTSADEIRNIITSLQQQSAIAVKDMSDSLVVSKNCVVTSNELGKILEEVKSSIVDLIGNVAQIAAATKQQNGAIQDTNSNIQLLSSTMDNALQTANTNSQISKQMAGLSSELQVISLFYFQLGLGDF